MRHQRILTLLALQLIYTSAYLQEHFRPDAQNPETRTINVDLPFLEGIQEVDVQVIDGMAVLDGCIVLGEISQFTGRGGAAATAIHTFWDDGIMPYEIESSHPRDSLIRNAINHINSNTNLRLQPRVDERDYVRFRIASSGCSTNGIGRANGERRINISSSCSMGNIVHEICHALGMYHEQTRVDRDSFVTIEWANIKNDWKAQFKKYTARPDYASRGGVDLGTYDYGSIMHYPNGLNSNSAIDPTRRTITPRRSGVAIGQRRSLSATDILTINVLARVGEWVGQENPTSSGSDDADSESTDSDDTIWPRDESGSVDIQYEVELVPQQTGFSCWAAGASMLVGWRDRVSINPSEIANGIGYWAQYQAGLDANDVTMFQAWGLEYEAPQTYTPQGLIQLISAYGPLWVATHEGAPHIRVIAGISGDGTADGTILTIYDPWQRGMRQFRPDNTGSIYQETYTEFERKQGELGRRELNEPAPYYVAHN